LFDFDAVALLLCLLGPEDLKEIFKIEFRWILSVYSLHIGMAKCT
jgi:hypothetical protein